MKKMVEEHLLSKIVPFWNRLVDDEYGGFYGYVGLDLKVDKKADKGAIKMARILYSYAALNNHFKNDEFLIYAQKAYEYIMNVLLDQTDGGVFWKSSYDGKIINDTKHIYAQSFTIYALAEYYLATKEEHVLEEAMSLFHLIENHASCGSSYWEQFDRNWQREPNKLLAINGVIPVFTTNTIIHLIEAYTSLYKVSNNTLVKESLNNLLSCFNTNIYDASQKACKVFFNEKWENIFDSISYGHDIECSWLIDEALIALNHFEKKYTKMTHGLAKNCYKRSYQDGWIISEKTNGHYTKDMIWWVQTEAIVGFLNLYQKTKKQKYYNAFKQTLLKTMAYIVDKREGGEWYWSVDQEGKPHEDRGISENWKANYHNVRACLEILKREENV